MNLKNYLILPDFHVHIRKIFRWVLPAVLLLLVIMGYWGFQSLKHRAKPIPINEFTYIVNKANDTAKGYLLLSPCLVNRWWHGRIMALDMMGNIVYQKYIKGSASNFRQWVIGGKIRYTYFVNDVSNLHSKDIKLAPGYFMVLDSTLSETGRINYVPLTDTEKSGSLGLDLHDVIPLSDDHYITMVIRFRKVSNIPDSLRPGRGITVAEPVFEEIYKGKIIWRWEGANFQELYESSIENNNYADTPDVADYLHLNSAVIDPFDSNLICSFRNSNQVLKISRKDGRIIWRFGGKRSDFALSPDQVFLRQHDVDYIPGTHHLIMMDNGDSLTRPYSRVLEFKLDEKRKKVDSFSSYRIPEGFAQYMGSAEKIGNRYLICGGSGNYILDIDPKTGQKHFELHSNLSSYRVYKIANIQGNNN